MIHRSSFWTSSPRASSPPAAKCPTSCRRTSQVSKRRDFAPVLLYIMCVRQKSSRLPVQCLNFIVQRESDALPSCVFQKGSFSFPPYQAKEQTCAGRGVIAITCYLSFVHSCGGPAQKQRAGSRDEGHLFHETHCRGQSSGVTNNKHNITYFTVLICL